MISFMNSGSVSLSLACFILSTRSPYSLLYIARWMCASLSACFKISSGTSIVSSTPPKNGSPSCSIIFLSLYRPYIYISTKVCFMSSFVGFNHFSSVLPNGAGLVIPNTDFNTLFANFFPNSDSRKL
jgi:hypothetical protein